MLSSFMWYILGCFTALILIKILHIHPIQKIQIDTFSKTLQITYHVYSLMRENIILTHQAMVDNHVISLEEAQKILDQDKITLDKWGQSMIELLLIEAKSGRYPYKLQFTDWETAKALIESKRLHKGLEIENID